MYEMQGPRSALQGGYAESLGYLPRAGRHCQRHPPQAPVSRLLPRLEVASEVAPSLVVNAVLLPPAGTAQGVSIHHFKIL
jgi:hypothetical protein